MGIKWIEKIRKEGIRARAGVTNISEKRHEGERGKDGSTRPENVHIENLMRRPQMGKRPEKKI